MQSNQEKIIKTKLNELSKSKFRTSFKLNKEDIEYINKKGLEKVKDHTYEFINEKLKPAIIKNDGKQTPTHNHPTFKAMHATATCCRECLYKWHHIAKDRELTNNEINYIVLLILTWIKQEYNKSN